VKIWTAAAAIAEMTLAVPSAQAFDYKAHRDFSYQNPNGVWSYGGLSIAEPRTFVPFDEFVSDAVPGFDDHRRGSALIGVNTTGKAMDDTGSSTAVIPNNMLQMHTASDEDTVVRFKVPKSGSYRFEGFYQIMDTSPNGTLLFILHDDMNINQIAFGKKVVRLTGKAAVRSEKNPKGGRTIKFDFTLDGLKRNQTISFGLNADGAATFDSTGFDVKVTPL
jgi:hypothetical protein